MSDVITDLLEQEIAELRPVGFFRIEYERILALLLQLRIIMPQMPVTALYCLLADRLCPGHTALDTVIDTRRISDYERRTGIASASLRTLKSWACEAPIDT